MDAQKKKAYDDSNNCIVNQMLGKRNAELVANDSVAVVITPIMCTAAVIAFTGAGFLMLAGLAESQRGFLDISRRSAELMVWAIAWLGAATPAVVAIRGCRKACERLRDGRTRGDEPEEPRREDPTKR